MGEVILNKKNNLQVVLIDDDDLVFMTWKFIADKENINLSYFKTIDSFLRESDYFSFDSLLFIDSNLQDGIKGEVESRKIYNKGFTRLYISTGDASIEKPDWIINILNKEFPYEVINE